MGKNPPIEETRLDELVTKLRAGDGTVREEIIKGHMQLASSIARRLAGGTQNPRYLDLKSVAYLALTEAVTRAGEVLKDNNITAYIGSTVTWACKNHIKNDHAFRVPSRTLARLKDKRIVLAKRESISAELAEKVADPAFLELLDSCIETEVEQVIVEQRIAGYTDGQIAEHFGWSRSHVTTIRQRIETRFNERARNEFRTRRAA